MPTTNPLLEDTSLPPFGQIDADQVEPAIDEILAANRKALEGLIEEKAPEGWALVQSLDNLEDRLNKAWSPVSHMNSVVNSDALREAYNRCLPKLTAYGTELGQHEGLYQAFESLASTQDEAGYDRPQRQVIDHALRDFKLSGIGLPAENKIRFGEIKTRLAELTTRFSEQVLDATQAWTKPVQNVEQLKGLPETALASAAQSAETKELEGYLLTLEFPSYHAVITYADDRALRREVYEAFVTRASDCGPHAGQMDNQPLIDEILALRHELARLLAFDNFAEYSLATKMAETPDQVIDFLRDLGEKSRPVAEQELQALQAFAGETFGVDKLEAWDIPYYSEKLRQQRYAVSQEQLRPYFPMNRVLEGLFAVVGRLFGIQVQEVSDFETWHPAARFFEIRRQNQVLGRFYLDPYARSGKRGGAWMDECRVRRRLDDGSLQLPVAYLVCNFSSPVGDQPALLTHNEVTTLFHEFGHGLHHMLTRVDYAAVSGINGVPWDAVELPSQFLENWCWEPEALGLISGHYRTGEPLPTELLDKMLAAKNFQAGMQTARQLEFALFDLLLHRDYQPHTPVAVQSVLDRVRDEVAVLRPPSFNRFQNSFTHVFSGGYAAGYYSYKWAEVLAADAFSRFEQEGVFNPDTGRAFLETILENGGSHEPMALFIRFRGREPQVEALLRHSGIL